MTCKNANFVPFSYLWIVSLSGDSNEHFPNIRSSVELAILLPNTTTNSSTLKGPFLSESLAHYNIVINSIRHSTNHLGPPTILLPTLGSFKSPGAKDNQTATQMRQWKNGEETSTFFSLSVWIVITHMHEGKIRGRQNIRGILVRTLPQLQSTYFTYKRSQNQSLTSPSL